jgi:hypothetical protein
MVQPTSTRYPAQFLLVLSQVISRIGTIPGLDQVKNLKDVTIILRQAMATLEQMIGGRKNLELVNIANAAIDLAACALVMAIICHEIILADLLDLGNRRKKPVPATP